ncbi:MAG: hypothetical protein MUE70_07545 [Desulfobacterales bacterium]|jgi:hypothetical protein|nr:hypothetical protein [Desulfobacterales bacterium]
MKLWSRGLGRTEVFMDFRYYKTMKDPEGDQIFIIGSMQDPVNWEFRITFTPEDVPGLIKTFFNFSLVKLLIKNIPRYFIYLWNHKKFIDKESLDIEKKVNDAYEQVMFGRRPGEKHRRASM